MSVGEKGEKGHYKRTKSRCFFRFLKWVNEVFLLINLSLFPFFVHDTPCSVILDRGSMVPDETAYEQCRAVLLAHYLRTAAIASPAKKQRALSLRLDPGKLAR